MVYTLPPLDATAHENLAKIPRSVQAHHFSSMQDIEPGFRVPLAAQQLTVHAAPHATTLMEQDTIAPTVNPHSKITCQITHHQPFLPLKTCSPLHYVHPTFSRAPPALAFAQL
eukprot:GFKZ01004729.1.p2 GENE.GFKZ01004729.1~~GFKZ01004729.1.p2  ORF type:complete len:113 (-),score=5.97 GFKZ01004729.1:1253-1591(-)